MTPRSARPRTASSWSRATTSWWSRASAASPALAARLLIEYHGGGFAGWARQPRKRTVQETLEAALARVLPEPVSLTVAGRTDAGVHARGQVAGHPGPAASADALNGVLPDDVAVVTSEPAPDGFDARGDALARTYRYRLFTRAAPSPLEQGRALHWPHALDRGALDTCATLTTGKRDFTAFTRTQTGHRHFERTVMRCEWLDAGEYALELWVEADAFLRNMVRILAGTMLDVSRGRLTLQEFERLLTGRPRTEAGDTAPAHGLYLESVRY